MHLPVSTLVLFCAIPSVALASLTARADNVTISCYDCPRGSPNTCPGGPGCLPDAVGPDILCGIVGSAVAQNPQLACRPSGPKLSCPAGYVNGNMLCKKGASMRYGCVPLPPAGSGVSPEESLCHATMEIEVKPTTGGGQGLVKAGVAGVAASVFAVALLFL